MIVVTANTWLCYIIMHLLEVVYMTYSLTYSHSSPMKRSLLFVLRNRELKASTARVSRCISSSARIWTWVFWLLSPLVFSVLCCSSRSRLFNQRPFTMSFTLFLGKNSFLVAEWPWAAYLISLCFSFFIINGDNNGTYVLGLLTRVSLSESPICTEPSLKGTGREGGAQGTGRQNQTQEWVDLRTELSSAFASDCIWPKYFLTHLGNWDMSVFGVI